MQIDGSLAHRACFQIFLATLSFPTPPSYLLCVVSPPQVPDDPSVKVFSKKKAAERTQHIFRSFSVPLRAPKGSEPHAELRTSASATAGHRDGKARSGGETTVKITLPENLPASAADIVERLKISLRCFKQVGQAFLARQNIVYKLNSPGMPDNALEAVFQMARGGSSRGAGEILSVTTLRDLPHTIGSDRATENSDWTKSSELWLNIICFTAKYGNSDCVLCCQESYPSPPMTRVTHIIHLLAFEAVERVTTLPITISVICHHARLRCFKIRVP